MRKQIASAIIALAVLGIAAQSMAVDLVGGGAITNILGTDYSLWSDTNNWAGAVLPTAGDAVIKANAYAGSAQTVGGHFKVNTAAVLIDAGATINMAGDGSKDATIGNALGSTVDLRGSLSVEDITFVKKDAVLTVNGGTLTSTDDLTLSQTANMVVNSGSVTSDKLELFDTSTMVINGGTVRAKNDIEIFGTSKLTMNGGTLQTDAGAPTELFDNSSMELYNATFEGLNQIIVGANAGANASLVATNSTITFAAGKDFNIGNVGGTGYAELTDITMLVDELKVGNGVGVGTLDFNSGVINVRQTLLGNNAGATGTMTMGDGATLNHTQTLKIGQSLNSVGVFNAGSNSVINMADKIILGNNVGADGTLNMAGGSALTAVNGLELGASGSGTGTVNMAAGSVMTIGTTVRIGDATDSVGTLVNDGTLNVGTDFIVAAGIGSTATYTSTNGGTVNIGGDLIIAGRPGSVGTMNVSGLALSAGGNFEAASGENSVATLNNSGAPIALNSTNGLFIGMGAGSTHNLTAADFVVAGPLGDFGVGANTGASIVNLISANDSIGSLTVNSALTITGGDHQLTGLTQNAALTFGGTSTHSLIGGGAITLANNDNANVVLTLADLNPVGDVNLTGFSIGTGSNAVGSFTMDSGMLNVAGAITVGNADGAGTLTLNGGDLLAGDVYIQANGTIALFAGTMTITNANTLSFADATSSLNIEGDATVTWVGDQWTPIDGFITDGNITWANGSVVDVDVGDKTWGNGTGSYLHTSFDGTETTVWVNTTIPEPSTLGLFAVLGFGMLWVRRRSRN
ncbi:beta strand repeat-containing protein [Pontiella sulfatireligans]|uniref:PEP-CTERM protein-sorting domain-containing protein n=1 Tax=Pontiella sulfatireligans TaxID=2750658 RepID=A0A6C2UUB0_9BACT|nr:PEP-CTERM sorting domain-containing protein [Pontiella sulfatireligans]VGO22931.1 hypothetical protein SCARR_05028 [Pontiella sulfatireligans]